MLYLAYIFFDENELFLSLTWKYHNLKKPLKRKPCIACRDMFSNMYQIILTENHSHSSKEKNLSKNSLWDCKSKLNKFLGETKF